MQPTLETTPGCLGTIVSWKVPTEVALNDLRRALAQAGLDTALANDMAPRNALSRALQDMKTNRVIRKLRTEGDNLVFQFTAETLGKYEATYKKEAELKMDLNTAVLWCSDNNLAQLAERLLKEHMTKRTTGDLTRLVQKIYDARRADLIPIRDQGGAYFVPNSQKDVVDKTRTLLKSIGGRLSSFEVRLGSGDTQESVANATCDYMLGLIAEFKESCQEVTADSNKRVVDNRHQKVNELRRRLINNRTLLSHLASTVEKEIRDADALLTESLRRQLVMN